MIATRDLRQLAAFTAEKTPVLSLYLDSDISRQLKDQVKLILRELLERARAAGAAEEDIKRINRYVDLEYDWQGRGLILFSCLDDGLWEPFPLPVPVQSQVYVGDQAYLMPFSNLLDRYEPYVVALVGQEGGRILHIDMNGVVHEEDTRGEPIKHHKQGGWSAPRFQRHEEKLADDNMKAAADVLSRTCAPGKCSRLILAGTEENIARFRALLPTALHQSIVGTMPLEMNAGDATVVDRSREILSDLDWQRQQDLVERVITYTLSGGVAVLGLADTLFALQEGRVMTMVVEEGFRAPGFGCADCDYLYIDEPEHCLFCGTANAQPVTDVVERAVHKAYLQGARVEIITESPALAKHGHIGALLRY